MTGEPRGRSDGGETPGFTPAGKTGMMRSVIRVTAPAAALLLAGAAVFAADDEPGLGPPPLYDELREAEPEPAGHIRGGRLWIDRFEFELERGDLYLVPPIGGRSPVAVFLGRGTLRAWPPDGVEHQQLRKLIDEDHIEEEFERFVFWFTGDLDERLRALVTNPPAPGGRSGRAARRQHGRAVDLLDDRREALLEDRLRNPDARVALDRWRAAAGLAAPADRPYFFAELDGREHDWFSIEIEPRDLEEVTIGKFDRRRKLLDVWMGFHALDEFAPALVEPTLGRFPPRSGDRRARPSRRRAGRRRMELPRLRPVAPLSRPRRRTLAPADAGLPHRRRHGPSRATATSGRAWRW